MVVSLNSACFRVRKQRLLRDVAQLGSAPLWGSGGRGFKSRRPDHMRDPLEERVFAFFLKKCFAN